MHLSPPSSYLPGNADFGDEILVRYLVASGARLTLSAARWATTKRPQLVDVDALGGAHPHDVAGLEPAALGAARACGVGAATT